MATTNDINIAASPADEAYTPPQLRAGDGPFQTRPGTVSSGQNLAQYAVVARLTATGELVEFNPAASPADGSEKAIGVLCYAVDASAADVKAAYYWSGFFNTDALVWKAGVTAAQKEVAFDGTAINHRKLINSVG